MEQRLDVLSEMKNHDLNHARQSAHLAERQERTKIYLETAGEGTAYKSFLVDSGHTNGLERHILMTNGLLYIYNIVTDKLVTLWRPSSSQINRYFDQLNLKVTYKARHWGYENDRLNLEQKTNNFYERSDRND